MSAEIVFAGGDKPTAVYVDLAKYRGWTQTQVVADLQETLGLLLRLARVPGGEVANAAHRIVTRANALCGETFSATPATGVPVEVLS